MNSNYRLGLLVAILNVAVRNHFSFLKVANCPAYFRILYILKNNGVLIALKQVHSYLIVFFKYKKGISSFSSLKVISKPGNRKWWSRSKLFLNSTFFSFSGFYILSTDRGFLTSQECLLMENVSGEVLLKVEI